MKPKCMEELLGISGFGKVKASKYGEGILEIIGKY
ncbi:MAG: HRDC domain-containing protein [Clostridium sp.]